jgi:Zn-dependent peptidase ImmA (M78 family)/transcriptional regulator with XRE-family HTH domain
MKQVIADNLIRYRKGARLSQASLAEKVGLTRQSINNYENAKTLPDSDILSSLAKALGVTIDDFLRPIDTTALPTFRFRARASFKEKPQFASHVLRALEQYTALEDAFGISPYAPESAPCHKVTGNEDRIQEIAMQFRHRLGLGDQPIFNLFESAEKIGLKVIRRDIPIREFSGLSACSAEHGAFILINTHEASIERQIFTLAHEIGHLICHRGDYQDNLLEIGTRSEESAREDVANFFASHFLIPQKVLEEKLKSGRNIPKLKAYFRVSYTMLLMRLDRLGELQYGTAIQKVRAEYKRRTGMSLTASIEIEPRLQDKEFPMNERFTKLILRALKESKISEDLAEELSGTDISKLNASSEAEETYAI